MRFGFVAPFNCLFNLNTHLLMTDKADFDQVCKEIVEKYHDPKGKFHQAGEFFFKNLIDFHKSGVKFYTSQKDGSSEFDPEIFFIDSTDKIQAYIAPANLLACNEISSKHRELNFQVDIEDCNIKFYDNAIGIATILLDVEPINPDISKEDFLHYIQEWSSFFVAHLIKTFYHEKIDPILKILQKHGKKGQTIFVQDVKDYPDYMKLVLDLKPGKKLSDRTGNVGQIKWVNITLFVDSLEEVDFDLLEKIWVVSTERLERLRDELRPEKPAFLGWGYNVIIGSLEQNLPSQAFRALHVCQYFYTIFENLGPSLLAIVGQSIKNERKREYAHQQKMLESVIMVVAVLRIQFDDLHQSLQGNTHLYINDLFRRWHMKTLMDGVDKKIKLCKEQVGMIQRKSQKVGQVVIESILFVLAGISLIEFFKNLADAGRNLNLRRNGFPGILDLAADYPPDLVIWFGIFLFATACGIFAHFQRKR